MKKISLLLALLLLVSALGLSAFATGSDSPDKNVDIDIQVKVDESMLIHKYSVDIDYASVMVFTYTKVGTWDSEKLAYTDVSGEWDSKTVKVTNRSDMPVKYLAIPNVTVDTYGDLEILLENGSGTIGKCYPGMPGGPLSETIGLTIGGVPNDELGETAELLGELVIKISKP